MYLAVLPVDRFPPPTPPPAHPTFPPYETGNVQSICRRGLSDCVKRCILAGLWVGQIGVLAQSHYIKSLFQITWSLRTVFDGKFKKPNKQTTKTKQKEKQAMDKIATFLLSVQLIYVEV